MSAAVVRAAEPAAPRAGDPLREAALLAGRTLRRFFRIPQAVVAALAFPVVMLFIQLAAFGEVVGSAIEGTYAQRVTPLVVLATASFAASATAISMHDDLHSGFLSRLRTMPLWPGALLGGRLLGDLARILVVAAITALLAHAGGFRFSQGALAALGFFGVVALFGAMVVSIALLAALSAERIETIQVLLGNPTTLLYFLSSGFVPLEAFPAALQPLVRVNPMSVVTEALIGLSAGGPLARPLAEAVAWTLAVSVACGMLAVHRYRRLLRCPPGR